jgi:pimeloyl-ACP methyl ester carboxylesterase
MKTVLFIPGFRESIKSRDYKSTLAAIESKGYQVQFVSINWARTTIEDWTKELNKEYSKHKPAETILAGFSYGSMTAFMAAVDKNPSELWLLSFSPYFSDDMPHMKKYWLSNIGHRRADSFRKLNFNSLAKSIKCKTLIIVGEVEAAKYPLIDRRSKIAHQKIANSNLVVVEHADHDVSDKNYVAAIKEAI